MTMQIKGMKVVKSSGIAASGLINSQPPFVVVCIPGNNFSKEFVASLIDTIGFFNQNGIRFTFSMGYNSVVYFARLLLLGADVLRGKDQKPFDGKLDYTHILWIDSDIVWSPELHIKPLFAHDVDIVSGLYPLTDGKSFAAVLKKDWDLDYFKEHGTFRFADATDFKDQKKLIEMAYAGFGFMLMKKGVMESLEYPWFKQIEIKIGDDIVDMTSEDTSACLRLREKGYKIWIDPKVRVGHQKMMIL
jgi:GT2 family glycosyltransferase